MSGVKIPAWQRCSPGSKGLSPGAFPQGSYPGEFPAVAGGPDPSITGGAAMGTTRWNFRSTQKTPARTPRSCFLAKLAFAGAKNPKFLGIKQQRHPFPHPVEVQSPGIPKNSSPGSWGDSQPPNLELPAPASSIPAWRSGLPNAATDPLPHKSRSVLAEIPSQWERSVWISCRERQSTAQGRHSQKESFGKWNYATVSPHNLAQQQEKS